MTLAHPPFHRRHPGPSALVLCGWLSLAAACGTDTSLPVPLPVPAPSISLLRLSTPKEPTQMLLVDGLPEAVAGSGRIIVRNLTTDGTVSAPTSAAGSFVAVLASPRRIPLGLRFEQDGRLSDEVIYSPQTPLPVPPELVRTRFWGSVISPANTLGRIVVSNDGGGTNPPLIKATPNSTVVVSNGKTGDVATTTTDARGVFRLELPGSPGDEIHILLVDPRSPEASSDFLTYLVPQ